jgi:hypothetical protein
MRARDWTLQYNLIWAAHSGQPTDCNCPEGYEPYNGECRKVTTEPAVQPPDWNPRLLVSKTYNQYGMYGMRVYNPGYNLDGTGTYTTYKIGYDFWWNYDGYPGSGLSGPMNRCGLWTEGNAQAGQQIGFSVCINIGADKIYYVGYGVDNYTTIRVDGVPVMAMPEISDANTFRYWHVYPVHVKKGFHVLEVIGSNVASIAAVGVQIYDATIQQLLTVTNQSELIPYLVFDSANLIGEYHTLGDGAYDILTDYALVLCDGTPHYRKVEYQNCQ